MKKAWGVAALMAAIIALLAGPSAAFAQEEGTAGESATTASEPATTETEATEVVVEEETTPAAVETESTPAEDSGGDATTQSTDSASTASGESTESAVASAQPQAKVESSSETVTNVSKDGSCGVTTYSATPRQGGSPDPGCDRVEEQDIPTIDDPEPSETEPIGPINGVTLGLWFDPDDDDDVVHWVVLEGTLSGTTAIDLHVKGGPDKDGFVCTISNVTVGATGTCNTPDGQGVSHVDACPATVPTTPTPTPTPPTTTTTTPPSGVAGQQGDVAGQKKAPPGEVSPQLVAAEAAVPGVPGLPVTGLDAWWLLLIGSGLLGTGAIVRTRLS